ncbi:hypothetical protein EVAR_64570_1 [Eumeta japonica]|uniref:Uncharacterized protein n=1 Tax=Eumeta variegata TaxID=151549 RepID=A0A4C1ZF89_EUMVA|nr:hypothetical protein EVAR_64570_1 [Eumeta japonica]
MSVTRLRPGVAWQSVHVADQQPQIDRTDCSQMLADVIISAVPSGVEHPIKLEPNATVWDRWKFLNRSVNMYPARRLMQCDVLADFVRVAPMLRSGLLQLSMLTEKFILSGLRGGVGRALKVSARPRRRAVKLRISG